MGPPIVIWALRDKMLRMAIPVTYALSAIVMVTLNMLQLRFSMYIGFALTIAVIGLYKALGK